MPEALMAGILGCTSERGEPFAYWLAPLERFRIVGHTEVTLRAARDDRHQSDNVRVARYLPTKHSSPDRSLQSHLLLSHRSCAIMGTG